MPIRYAISTPQELVLSVATGEVSDAELRSHQQAIAADPRFDREYVQLWDARESVPAADRTSPSLQFVTAPHVRRAIVVSTKLAFGLGRQLEMTRFSDHEGGLRIFSDIVEALDWIERTEADYRDMLDNAEWIDV